MGVKIADEKQYSNGLVLNNSVVTIKADYRIGKFTNPLSEIETYRVWYTCYYYISQTAYEQKKGYIESSYHQIDILPEQLNDIFGAIYTEIKSGYQSTTDI